MRLDFFTKARVERSRYGVSISVTSQPGLKKSKPVKGKVEIRLSPKNLRVEDLKEVKATASLGNLLTQLFLETWASKELRLSSAHRWAPDGHSWLTVCDLE